MLKKTIKASVCILIGLFACIPSVLQSQDDRPYTYISVGGMLGVSHYQGDLDDNGFDFGNLWGQKSGQSVGNPFLLMRPAFGAYLNVHFHQYMYVRFTLSQGFVGAHDKHGSTEARRTRNLHFRSPISELSAQWCYEFLGKRILYQARPDNRTKVSPYFFGGVAGFWFNPQAKPDKSWVERYPELFADDRWVNLQPLGTEGQFLQSGRDYYQKPYSRFAVAFPVGMGLRFKITREIDLSFEVGYRVTLTDYIDDVSGNVAGTYYPNPNDFIQAGAIKSMLFSDRSAGMTGYETRANRGDPNQNDVYVFSMFSLGYIIDKNDRCADGHDKRRKMRSIWW